jgi:hypothetical protein
MIYFKQYFDTALVLQDYDAEYSLPDIVARQSLNPISDIPPELRRTPGSTWPEML